MYLKIQEMMNIMEMIRNMMNHMDEYQAMFQLLDGFGGSSPDANGSGSPMNALASFFCGPAFSMPDFSSLQNIMKGSDLVDEFTYVEKPSGARGDGA